MLALFCALAVPGSPGAAADPFTVSNIEVDVTAKDPQQAKLKAISEAQVKAFHELIERIAPPEQAARLASLDAARIGRMMSSMSVQKEQTGPNRYIATLTISFLPDKIRELLDRRGVEFTETQAPPTTILPVWIGRDGPVLWTNDNPWLAAWRKMDLRNGVAPVVLPLGDAADAAAVTAEKALSSDPAAFDAVAVRYRTETVLTATAEQTAMNAVRVTANGLTSAGPVSFDQTYNIADGNLDGTLATAAAAVFGSIQQQWKSVAAQRYEPPVQTQKIRLAVPFTSLAEWTAIRGRLLSTPGIANIDVESLSGTGAITTMEFQQSVPQLQQHLARSGFILSPVGDTWVLQTR
ncbi:DUF2066 domain-containing protein [Rhodoligotrophos defluvii]|uniref:DUF2066 domain-containing protein n=1 Tax=Rhodoligotrophos defluvii TaxID=2561934 RepID=UPI001EEFDF91|nr:DUF2066 domain-containing protein [Rhodoligotrophos defluvii]